MKRVYETALKSVIWLGPAKDDSDTAMEYLQEVGKEAYEFGLRDMT